MDSTGRRLKLRHCEKLETDSGYGQEMRESGREWTVLGSVLAGGWVCERTPRLFNPECWSNGKREQAACYLVRCFAKARDMYEII